MTDGNLLRAVRHNCWANGELIAFCGRLKPEQLEWTVPGSYGSIHRTLQHIIGAEHGYLFALTGGQLPPGGPLTPDRLVTLDELGDRSRSNLERMEAVLAGGSDPDRVIQRRQGTATAGIIVAQFIHHGSDHRAHVGTILGAHGVEPPDLDVWVYGSSLGQVKEPA